MIFYGYTEPAIHRYKFVYIDDAGTPNALGQTIERDVFAVKGRL